MKTPTKGYWSLSKLLKKIKFPQNPFESLKTSHFSLKRRWSLPLPKHPLPFIDCASCFFPKSLFLSWKKKNQSPFVSRSFSSLMMPPQSFPQMHAWNPFWQVNGNPLIFPNPRWWVAFSKMHESLFFSIWPAPLVHESLYVPFFSKLKYPL